MTDTEDRLADARLAGELLRGGVGLRYVRRALRELRDHRRDLEEHLMARGYDHATAASEAREMLGDLEHLVAQMSARPELRSRVRRFAWLLFVVGPLPMICVTGLLAILVAQLILMGSGVTLEHDAALEMTLVRACLQWVAPLTVGLLLCRVAARRRMPPTWPICAISIAAAASGAIHYATMGTMKTLFIAPYPTDPGRVATMLVALGLAYLAFRGRESRITAA
jgi:hypothetical protein